VVFQGIREAEFDERLTRDADALRLLIDGLEQIDGEVDIHTLDLAAGTTCLRPIDIRRRVNTGLGKPIELFSCDPFRLVLCQR
jgi:hypothetical protein